MKDLINKYNKAILTYYILIILISEFITKVLIQVESDVYFFSTVLKLLFGIYFLFHIYYNKLWSHQLFKYVVLILVSFIIGQVFISLRNGVQLQDFYNNIFTLSTYVYLPLFVININSTTINEIIIKNIFIVKIIALINVPIIIFGLAVPLEIFKSYPGSARFGFNGLIGFSSSASFFYIALLIILYCDYYYNKSLKNKGLLILQAVISIMVGTKTIWFFLILLFIIHFCVLISKKYRYISQVLLASAVGVYFLFKEAIQKFTVSLFSFGEEYYQEYGFVTVITSTRDLFLKKVWVYYLENFTLNKFFFGGINVIKIRVEFEFINMFIFFGLIGTVIYLSMILKIFYQENQSLMKTLIFVILMVTCALSGGFFYNTLSASLLYITLKYTDIYKSLKT